MTHVQKLARILRIMVIILFVCNILALVMVPVLVGHYGHSLSLRQEGATITIGVAVLAEAPTPLEQALLAARNVAASFVNVWMQPYTAILTLFLWVCGICTAVILWQGKRMLDNILRSEPFTLGNAANLRRAAVCCFVISGAALIRAVSGLICYQSFAPLLTYNSLFVPVFLMAGLLCMVMSALFRQAAELKADNDLTI